MSILTIVIYGEAGVRPEDLEIYVKGEPVRVLFVPDKDLGVSEIKTQDFGTEHDEEVNAAVEQRPINPDNFAPFLDPRVPPTQEDVAKAADRSTWPEPDERVPWVLPEEDGPEVGKPTGFEAKETAVPWCLHEGDDGSGDGTDG